MGEPTEGARDAEVDLALARSVVYRMLALGLARPTPESAEVLSSREARRALMAAARLLDARLGAPSLAPTVGVLVAQDPGTLGERRRQYGRLFGHAEAPVPPFETEYGAGVDHGQPQRLADIAGYYLAFGLRPAARLDERVDHVACQCEFLDFLARKEAFLIAAGPEATGPLAAAERAETLAAARDAARGFLRDHLGRFGRAFVTRLVAEDRDGYFAALGALLRGVLDLDCRRLEVPPGPATLNLRPPEADPVPMACGSREL